MTILPIAIPKPLPTQEIGSLPKPIWLVRGIRGQQLTPSEVKELNFWSKKINFLGKEELTDLIQKGDKTNPERYARFCDLNNAFGLQFIKHAGLSLLYNGELDPRRIEMYQQPANNINNFTFFKNNAGKEEVRVVDALSYKKAVCTGTVCLKNGPYHHDEFESVRNMLLTLSPYQNRMSYTKGTRDLKVPVTSAFTMQMWSDNIYYHSRRELCLALAQDIIKPVLEDLIQSGAQQLQIDGPAEFTSSSPYYLDMLVDSFNASFNGIPNIENWLKDGGEVSMHLCYSNYTHLLVITPRLRYCTKFSIETANKDSWELGITDKKRKSTYTNILDIFKKLEHQTGKKYTIGLGVVDVHTQELETPQLIHDRIICAVKHLGEDWIQYLHPSIDCGLRAVKKLDIAYQKLVNLERGAALARKTLRLE